MDNLLQNGRESVLRAFSQASSYVRGRRVIVDQNGTEITGVTDGLDPQGFLLLRTGQRDANLDPRRRSAARMILALDAGNTNITIGAFRGWRSLVGTGGCARSTIRPPMSGASCSAISSRSATCSLANVDGIIIASVVPPLDSTLAAMSRQYFDREPMFVTSRNRHRPANPVRQPARGRRRPHRQRRRRVSQVRRALRRRRSRNRHHLRRSLRQRGVSRRRDLSRASACRFRGSSAGRRVCPLVDFREPERVIGTNTVASMQSGLYYGVIGMIDGILERLKAQLGRKQRRSQPAGSRS